MFHKILIKFVFILFTISIITLAQQNPKLYKYDTEKLSIKDTERKDFVFSEQEQFTKPVPIKPFSDKSLFTLDAIVPDFQVNENSGSNGASQIVPSISAFSNGNFIIVWLDGRNGDEDIFAQRFKDGAIPIGVNFRVNDDQGSSDQQMPSISSDSSGNFIISWGDHRDGTSSIYAQRYSSNGNPIGGNFKVNDDQAIGLRGTPSVSISNNGNFIISWEDTRNGNWDIFTQRYSSDGNLVGNNFKVNNDVGTGEQYMPYSAIDDMGNFIIAWLDYRDGSNIFAQRFSNDGNGIGDNFKVNDEHGMASWSSLPISSDNLGNFVITWVDFRNNNSDIYAQRYLSDGIPIGNNFKVNNDEGSSVQELPSISMNNNGNIIISWTDERNGDSDIYAQQFSSSGTPIGSNVKVNDSNGISNSILSSISVDDEGNYVITWDDKGNGDYNIYAQRFMSNGELKGVNFKVNDDTESADQGSSSIITDNFGNIIISWVDQRNGVSDIFAQRFSSEGSFIGANIKVNDDQGNTPQWGQSIAGDSNGNFVISWVDERNEDTDIYAQRYLNNGDPIGANVKVNDDLESAWQREPSISVDYNGNCIITWQDKRNGDYDIYAQRYSSDGNLIGTNFKVNDDHESINNRHSKPSISVDGNGNFIISWLDQRNSAYSIFAQRYSSAGSPLGANFRVNDDNDNLLQDNPAISANSSGNFVIAWERRINNYNTDIYAQRYSSDGNHIGNNFKVNDDEGDKNQKIPSICLDENGNFIVMWQDERNEDFDIYGQIYSSDGSTIGANFIVTNNSGKNQTQPDVKTLNGRIYNSWTDNRTGGSGYDIWANVLDWDNLVSIGDKQELHIPTSFSLEQNYPNPFNPTTNIEYRIAQGSYVTLNIYDPLGRIIKTLVSEYQKAGNYMVSFDATNIHVGRHDLTSSIYFYTLRANNFIQTNKMILIK